MMNLKEFKTILLNKTRHYVLIVFLFAIPLMHSPTVNARDHQQAWFQYAAMVILALFIGNLWIGAFIIWNVILYIMAGEQTGSMQVLNVFFGASLFMVSRWYFKKNSFEDYYKPIIFISIASIFWMALQLFGIDPLFRGVSAPGVAFENGFSDPVGLFNIKMANGIFLTTAMPIVAAINPLLSLLYVIPIYLSESSSVFMALAVAILFYVYHQHRFIQVKRFKVPLFLVLSVLIPISGLIYVAKDLKNDPLTFKSRFPSWHMVIHMGFNRALTGYGPDSFRNLNNLKRFKFHSDGKYRPIISHEIGPNKRGYEYYSPTNNKLEVLDITGEVTRNGGFPNGLPKNNKGEPELNFWDNPHNLILTIFLQYGIIGLLLFYALLREMFYRFRFSMKDKELVTITNCILVLLVSSLTHFPFELARIAYLAPVLLGAFYAKTDEEI